MIIIGLTTLACNHLDHCLILDCCSLNSSSSVWDLGILFDSNLSFKKHVSRICKKKKKKYLYIFLYKKIYLNYDLFSQCQMQKHSFVFLFSAQTLKNLPDTVREADTLCQFKSRLKTHLFNLVYT